MNYEFKVGDYVNNTKWRGKIVHISPHTLTIEVTLSNGEIRIYRRKKRKVKISSLFNEFKVGDRCYVFDWYSKIYDYENVMFGSNKGVTDAVVIHTEPFLKIKLIGHPWHSHQYELTYFTDADIKKILIHRNKFLKDLDVGRYGEIKIDTVLNNASINATNYYNSKGYTQKSWILSKNEMTNQICCVTHYDCDIENCKYKKEKYLITFTPIDEFEYCNDLASEDNIENRKFFKKICSNIFNKYVGVDKKNTAMFITVTGHSVFQFT